MVIKFFDRLSVFRTFINLVNDPVELNHVMALERKLSAIASDEQKKAVVKGFTNKAHNQNFFRDRPRLGDVPMEKLRQLPANTLGRQYVEFLETRNLDPKDLPIRDPQNEGDPFDYSRAHIFETHDIWHVVTGFETDVAGELGLQIFYFTQYQSPMAFVLVAAGLLNQSEKTPASMKHTLDMIIRGYHLGELAHGFIGRDWKLDWGKDLDALRAELGIGSQLPGRAFELPEFGHKKSV